MPAQIKNLNKAAKRILKAIESKEKIILYGDADLDGVAAVIILKETIKNLGGEAAAVYFPDRQVEGHGISETGLNFLKKLSPALLIALDCGIGNFKEVKLAKKMGLEVIIIDHHEVLDKLPEASLIVDPKQKGDKYPFKNLAICGIVFKLAEILLREKLTENLKNNFLELTALGTIADMMPREADNQVFIAKGLKSLENSWRPGIKTFLNSVERDLTLEQKVSKLISILNVRDVEENLPASFRLLTLSSPEQSKMLIERLLKKNEQKKEKIAEIIAEVEKRLLNNEEKLIFEGDSGWDFILISAAASILVKKHKKPTFIFKKLEKESQGTVRTPSSIDSVFLMKKCQKHLLTFGGHAQASGFRIKNENLEKFKECLIKNL